MSHDPIDDAFQKRHELNIALSREYIAELESEVAALRAEVEGMREDAERYREVRRDPSMLLHLKNSEFDAAIDKRKESRNG